MKLAIMQPYFLPYLGYFQLLHAVDAFVVYDDVNYMKGGWINRNFILSQGRRTRITLQLEGASPNRLINEVNVGGNRRKLLRTLEESYARAPYAAELAPLLKEILGAEERNLAVYLTDTLRRLCTALKLDVTWFVASELGDKSSLRGADRVREICQKLGAQHYVNLPGGRSLYERRAFDQVGIELSFIEPGEIRYDQGIDGFEPDLSIIDVMMFNGRVARQHLLEQYTLA